MDCGKDCCAYRGCNEYARKSIAAGATGFRREGGVREGPEPARAWASGRPWRRRQCRASGKSDTWHRRPPAKARAAAADPGHRATRSLPFRLHRHGPPPLRPRRGSTTDRRTASPLPVRRQPETTSRAGENGWSRGWSTPAWSTRQRWSRTDWASHAHAALYRLAPDSSTSAHQFGVPERRTGRINCRARRSEPRKVPRESRRCVGRRSRQRCG